jgi:hypothetical protein
MATFKKSFDHFVSEKPSQLSLGVIFVIYILFNIQTPDFLAEMVDTIFGKVLVVVIAAILFMKTNPVIGVLGFVVAYQIIKTSSVATGTYGMKHYLPSEESKMNEMRSFNDETVMPPSAMTQMKSCGCSGACSCLTTTKTNFNGALEEEMVDKMAPLIIKGPDSNLEYKPVLDNQYGASLLE